MKKAWTLGLVLVASAASLAACGGDGKATPGDMQSDSAAGGQVTLVGAGATFPYPVYSKWFDAYSQTHPVRVNYQSIGSGGGIRQLTEKTVDFGASDAPMNEEELANHRPIPWTARYRALEECVGALRALWTDEQAEFHGEFFDFDPVWSLPKPERPHGPPVVCGMSGRLGTAHAVRWADGWMPMDLALGDLEGAHGGVHASSLANKIDRFRAAAADAGRGELPISMVTWGDPTPDTLRAYRDLGVHRVLLGAGRKGWTDAASARPFIERYAAVLDELATS